jgi:hypothetical protein
MPRLYNLVGWSTFLWGVFFSVSFVQSHASADEPPNILFILVDDMGWRDLSCSGNEVFETPNLDKLAERGMRFTNAPSHPEIVKTMKAEYEKWWKSIYPHATKILPPVVEQEWEKAFYQLRKPEFAPTYEVPAL